MCTQYLYSSTPFPLLLPLSTGINPPDRTLSALLFSDFVFKKRRKKERKRERDRDRKKERERERKRERKKEK
jgi:hypothetical protein